MINDKVCYIFMKCMNEVDFNAMNCQLFNVYFVWLMNAETNTDKRLAMQIFMFSFSSIVDKLN